MEISPGTTASSFGNKEYYIPLQPREMVLQGLMMFMSNINSPTGPSLFTTSTAELPLSLFSTDTTESAGWDTTAQNTPAEDRHTTQLISICIYRCKLELALFTEIYHAKRYV